MCLYPYHLAAFAFALTFPFSTGSVLRSWKGNVTVGHAGTFPRITSDEAYEVEVKRGLSYGKGLVCNKLYKGCKAKNLLLDVYDPKTDATAPRPAMVLVHGGAESQGSRTDDVNVQTAASFFSARGFVVFAIDFRLRGENGLYPCQDDGCHCMDPDSWYAQPCYVYCPIRDYKAAIRFVRANKAKFNVDDQRIVANGGSSGATNILVAALADEDLYKTELSLKDDPTLASTNLRVSSSVRVAVLHWPFSAAVDAGVEAFGRDRFFNGRLPAVLHFHGSVDFNADIGRAKSLARELKHRGMTYDLVILQGCTHMAWCGSPFHNQNCNAYTADLRSPVKQCQCKVGCPLQEIYSLPFIVKELGLPLQ